MAPVHAADERVLEEGEESRGAVALDFMHDNFGRVHQTLRAAMEAGVANHVWGIEEIVGLLS